MNKPIVAMTEAWPFIRHYRNKTFVIKAGGAVLSNPEAVKSIAQQCAMMSDLGIRIVLVHGGGAQATKLSRRLGIEPQMIAGRRITDAETLEVAKMVYAGTVNVDLVSALREQGAAPVGISGVDAGMIVAKRRPLVKIKDDSGNERTVDFGFVGDIQSVNTNLCTKLLQDGFLPVVACLGADEKGHPLNINGDTVAEALAKALEAEKLIFLTDMPGILRDSGDPSSLIPFADADELASVLESGIVAGGMRPKVEACIRAATAGVKRTHIIDGTAVRSLLLEVFTGEGTGTMIVGDREKQEYQEKQIG
jgi:acetylglutamate kinase